jgi:hypothetical protein
MSAEIINLLDRRRPAKPSEGVYVRRGVGAFGQACIDYLQASTQVGVLREAAIKLGWIVPKDPREATIAMAAQLMRLGCKMSEAIPLFAPDLARAPEPQKPPVSRRRRSKPKD